MKNLIFFLMMAVVVISCGTASSTNMQSSWQKPASSVSLRTMNKVMVFAMTNDNNQRRIIEDAYVSQLGSKAVPSYSSFANSIQQVSASSAESKLSNEGYDGAIVIRLENHQKTGSKRKTRVSVDPSVYFNFHGNVNAGIGVGISPGYNTEKNQYTIETTVYDIPQGDLLWSGNTLATNPNDINSFASSLASKVISQMKSDGFD